MNERKLAGLFINCPEAKDSIYESGKMAFECLQNSDVFSLDYLETREEVDSVSAHYDFYLFNYHIGTMPRLDTKSLRDSMPGVKMTIVLEISPNDPFVYCSSEDFDAYCVLDPTLNIKQSNSFAFPRPLEAAENSEYQPPEIPVIGSFGFATPGKGFEHVIDAVNREFEKAVVRINIPYSTYADESGILAQQLAQMCREKARDSIEVVVTHDFMTKPQLIEWCGENTLNCFLYDRNLPGLAATTDQAIASGRPLITSKNNTFRHIQKYIKPFPYQSLKNAIEKTPEKVAAIQNDWSAKKFRERFEQVLDNFQFDNFAKAEGTIKLPLFPASKKSGLPKPLQNIKNFVAVRTRLKNYRNGRGLGIKPRVKPLPVNSYSQFGEDLIVNSFFDQIPVVSVSYLDIGAKNPQFHNNTYSFYERGFSGVLVESSDVLCENLKTVRPRDLVLNAAASTSEKVKMPLLKINDIIADYFTECPDFISIDVEGWDLKILENFDFEKYSPAVFCVETLAHHADDSTYRIAEINELMERKNYFSLAQTEANDIFVNKNLYDFYVYQKEQREQAEQFNLKK